LSYAHIEFAAASHTKLGVVVSNGVIESSTASTSSSISSDATSAYNSNADDVTSVIVKPSGAVGSVMQVSFFQDSTVSSTSPSNGTLIGTYALTVAAAGVSNVVSAAKSGLAVDTTAGSATVDVADGYSVANGGTGYLDVTAKDAYGVALSGAHAVTVSATGGAYVGFSAFPSAASAVSATIPSNVYITQGTANVAANPTVTVTVDGVVIGTKAITIAGDLAKIVLTQNFTGGTSGSTAGASSVDALSYKAYDAAGNRVPLAAPSLKGTNASVVSGSVHTAETASVTGKISLTASTLAGSAVLYLTATNYAGSTITSNTVTENVGGDLYTYTAKLDKSVYHMGDIATLTIKTLDSKGMPANDVTTIGTSSLKPAISGSYMTAVSAPLYTDVTTNSVITYQFIVGNTPGTYAMAVDLPAVTSPTVGSDTPKTLGYTIANDGSVSNAEVLSAIVKLIGSINKQIAALQKALKK
jgi:hypothetical protein